MATGGRERKRAVIQFLCLVCWRTFRGLHGPHVLKEALWEESIQLAFFFFVLSMQYI
jgi:hypothetical protein